MQHDPTSRMGLPPEQARTGAPNYGTEPPPQPLRTAWIILGMKHHDPRALQRPRALRRRLGDLSSVALALAELAAQELQLELFRLHRGGRFEFCSFG